MFLSHLKNNIRDSLHQVLVRAVHATAAHPLEIRPLPAPTPFDWSSRQTSPETVNTGRAEELSTVVPVAVSTPVRAKGNAKKAELEAMTLEVSATPSIVKKRRSSLKKPEVKVEPGLVPAKPSRNKKALQAQ